VAKVESKPTTQPAPKNDNSAKKEPQKDEPKKPAESNKPVAAPQKPAQSTQPTPTTDDDKKKGGKTWLWVLVGVIVVGLLAWMFTGNSDDESGTATDQTEQTTAPIDGESVTDDAVVPEANAEQEGETSEEAEISTPSVQAEEQPIPAPVPEQQEAVVDEPAVDEPVVKETSQPKLVDTPTIDKGTFNTLSLEDKARVVIKGLMGNGQERRDNLGADYPAVQKKVNEFYARGLVK
jgi:hypothetical protein